MDCKQTKIIEARKSGQANPSRKKLNKSDNNNLDEAVLLGSRTRAQKHSC